MTSTSQAPSKAKTYVLALIAMVAIAIAAWRGAAFLAGESGGNDAAAAKRAAELSAEADRTSPAEQETSSPPPPPVPHHGALEVPGK